MQGIIEGYGPLAQSSGGRRTSFRLLRDYNSVNLPKRIVTCKRPKEIGSAGTYAKQPVGKRLTPCYGPAESKEVSQMVGASPYRLNEHIV
jgi:hypothetical protein